MAIDLRTFIILAVVGVVIGYFLSPFIGGFVIFVAFILFILGL